MNTETIPLDNAVLVLDYTEEPESRFNAADYDELWAWLDKHSELVQKNKPVTEPIREELLETE